MKKRYIVRKYIEASSGKEALRIEKNYPADECWVDDKWLAEATVRGFDKKK